MSQLSNFTEYPNFDKNDNEKSFFELDVMPQLSNCTEYPVPDDNENEEYFLGTNYTTDLIFDIEHMDDGNSTELQRSKRGRTRRTFIITPSDVLSVESLLRLEPLKTLNLPEYIGELDDVSIPNIRKAVNFLARYDLIANERACDGCPGAMAFQKDSSAKHDQHYWRCLDCRRSKAVMKKSIRKDSFFQGLRLSVHQILYLAADFIENPTRHLEEIADSFQIDKNTVSEVHEWFRDLTQQWFVRTIEDNPVKMLGGKGKFVEIDETAMFRAKYNRGHMVDRPTVWVFGLLERKTNKIAMFQVVQRDARILLPIIKRYVKPGTTIISDGWAAYRRISQIPDRRYKHKVINHKLHFVSPTDPTVHTQGIEASWGALKSSLKSRHGIRDYMAKGHLYNYIFRRYNNKDKLLNRLIMEMGYYNRAQATLVPNDFDELHPAEDSDYSDDDNDEDNDDNEDVEDDDDEDDDEDNDEDDDDNQDRGEEDDDDNDNNEHRYRQDDDDGDDEGDDEDEEDDDDEEEEEEEEEGDDEDEMANEDEDHENDENDDNDESEDKEKEADRRETRYHSSNDGSDSDGLSESRNNDLRRPANADSRTEQSSSSSSSSDADSSGSEYVLPRSSRFGQRMQKLDKPSSSSRPSTGKTKDNKVKDSKSSKKQKNRQKNAPPSTSSVLARSRSSSPHSSAAEKAEIIHGTSKASIRRTQRGKGRRDGMVFSAEIRQQQMDKNHRNSGKKPARGKGSRGGKVANQLRKEKEDRLSSARDEEANEDEEAEERRNLIAKKTRKTGAKKTKKAKELGKAENQAANPIAGRTRNAAAKKTKEGNEVKEAEEKTTSISERTRNAGTKEPNVEPKGGKKKKNGGKGKKNGSKRKS